MIHSSPGGPVAFISNYYNEVATLSYWAAWLRVCVILLFQETHHVLCIYLLLSKKTKKQIALHE